MTLILICVFGISAGHPGTPKMHVLSKAESSRIAAFDESINDSCEDCSDEYERQRRTINGGICKAAFGRVPDLTWIEARQTAKGGRS